MLIREKAIKQRFGATETKPKVGVNLENTISSTTEKPKTKTYIVLGVNMLGTQIVKSRCLSGIKDKSGFFREIRYVKGAPSIFVDEQKDKLNGLKQTPISLNRGRLLVSDPLLMDFLDSSSQNVSMKLDGVTPIFKLEDIAADAEVELERKRIVTDAVHNATTALSIAELKPIARSLGMNNISLMKDHQIRLWASDFAEKNPEKFNSMIDNPLPPVIDVVSRALEMGVIELVHNKSRVAWKGAGVFLTIPPGYEEQRIEFIARNLLTNELGDALVTMKVSVGDKVPDSYQEIDVEVSNDTSEKDAEIEALKKELESLKSTQKSPANTISKPKKPKPIK